uniref:Uncharacterized protein n=1 Tax=Rhizophora mucronata TaxID=61149 RepID=A0A2P2MG90_RHIMU
MRIKSKKSKSMVKFPFPLLQKQLTRISITLFLPTPSSSSSTTPPLCFPTIFPSFAILITISTFLHLLPSSCREKQPKKKITLVYLCCVFFK